MCPSAPTHSWGNPDLQTFTTRRACAQRQIKMPVKDKGVPRKDSSEEAPSQRKQTEAGRYLRQVDRQISVLSKPLDPRRCKSKPGFQSFRYRSTTVSVSPAPRVVRRSQRPQFCYCNDDGRTLQFDCMDPWRRGRQSASWVPRRYRGAARDQRTTEWAPSL